MKSKINKEAWYAYRCEYSKYTTFIRGVTNAIAFVITGIVFFTVILPITKPLSDFGGFPVRHLITANFLMTIGAGAIVYRLLLLIEGRLCRRKTQAMLKRYELRTTANQTASQDQNNLNA